MPRGGHGRSPRSSLRPRPGARVRSRAAATPVPRHSSCATYSTNRRPGGARRRLCGQFVFVQQPAEPVATPQTIERRPFCTQRRFAYGRRLRQRRTLGERAVRPMLVAVLRVHVNDALEVAAAEDQQPVKACAPQACDPALGVRTSPRRPHGRPNHADARGAENLVEAARELRDAAALVRTLLEFRGRDDEPALPFLSTVATVLACFRRFRGLGICHRLPLDATARLH